MLLDGDTLRHGLNGDLGFSDEDRTENIRRAGEAAKLFYESGHIVLCAFISPFEKDRALVRSLVPENSFLEVFAKCSLEVCERRDPNGLYKKARSGQIERFTGISSPYEPPQNAEMIAETDVRSVEQLVDDITQTLIERGILGPHVIEDLPE